MSSEEFAEWYVLRGNKQLGPHSFTTLLQAAERGALSEQDLIWRTGWGAWHKANTIRRLFIPPPPSEAPQQLQADSSLVDHPALPETTVSASNKEVVERQAQKASPAHSNYFLRHWRGDLSLPVSYWVNNILCVLTVYAIALGVGYFLEDNKNIGSIGVVIVLFAFLAILIGLAVWQMVGVWRSASNHTARGGRAFWAGLAKIMVCLGALRTLVDLSNFFVPVVSEHIRIALGDDRYGQHTFRILRNGTELEFSGGISVGVAKELRQILDAASQITVLHLNSIGGRVAEANDMADQILKRRLITYVSDQCVSACTHIFMAGRERWLSERAKLGFHRPDFPGLRDEDQIPIIQQERRYLLSLGIPADFVDKVLSTPTNSMWWPTQSELIAAHVISGRVNNDRFAASGAFAATAATDRLADALMKVPVYAALKKVEPKAFENMLSRLSEGYRQGDTEDAIFASARSVFSQIIRRFLPRASDELLLEAMDIYSGYMNGLKSVDPESCVALEDNSKGARLRADLGKQFPELAKRELATNEAIILLGASERSIPTEKQVGPQLEKIMRTLDKKLGGDVELLDKPVLEKAEYKRYCEVAVAFYQEVKLLPRKQATELLRYLYSQN